MDDSEILCMTFAFQWGGFIVQNETFHQRNVVYLYERCIKIERFNLPPVGIQSRGDLSN